MIPRMTFVRPIRGDLIATAAALALGIGSAVLLPSLTYDSWAWMVWARELAHLKIAESGGPVMKPLPVILMAPLGSAAPLMWLALVRGAFLLCGWAAWRVGKRLDGGLSGILAGVSVLVVPGLFRTALQGYSEPLFVLFVLLAVLSLLHGRAPLALLALVLAGLLRSEEWPYLLAVAIWAVHSGRVRPLTAIAAVLAPPLIWFGIDWAATGDPMRSLSHAAAGRGRSVSQQVDFLTDDLGLLNLLAALVALVIARRRSERAVLLMLAAAASWVIVILLKAALELPVGGRYLIPAAALLAVCGGWGVAQLLQGSRLPRAGVIGLAAALVALVSIAPMRRASEEIKGARSQVRAGNDLGRAIEAAGGRTRIAAYPGPAVMVNTPMLTELAWRLDVPLARVATVWRNHPNDQLVAPAVVFEAPAEVVGSQAPIPARFRVEKLARVAPWQVGVLRAMSKDQPAKAG